MLFVHRVSLLASLSILFIALSSCDNTPTGPAPSSGNLLEATIDGTDYSFTLHQGTQKYDTATTLGQFGGVATNGTTTRTLTASFVSNINTGSFPRTVPHEDVTITFLTMTNGSVTGTYDCIADIDQCSITLTGKSGKIVDGTLTARLTNRADTTQHVAITDGKFSVTLE